MQDIISALLEQHCVIAAAVRGWCREKQRSARRRSKSDLSRMETGLECTSSRTSWRALRFVDLGRPRRCLLPSSSLATASLRAVRSANCGCVRPALSASSVRDRSNRSAGRPPRPVPPRPLLASVPLLRPVRSRPPVRVRRRGHSRAHHSTTVTISSSSTLPTPAHSAMSMHLNAAD